MYETSTRWSTSQWMVRVWSSQPGRETVTVAEWFPGEPGRAVWVPAPGGPSKSSVPDMDTDAVPAGGATPATVTVMFPPRRTRPSPEWATRMSPPAGLRNASRSRRSEWPPQTAETPPPSGPATILPPGTVVAASETRAAPSILETGRPSASTACTATGNSSETWTRPGAHRRMPETPPSPPPSSSSCGTISCRIGAEPAILAWTPPGTGPSQDPRMIPTAGPLHATASTDAPPYPETSTRWRAAPASTRWPDAASSTQTIPRMPSMIAPRGAADRAACIPGWPPGPSRWMDDGSRPLPARVALMEPRTSKGTTRTGGCPAGYPPAPGADPSGSVIRTGPAGRAGAAASGTPGTVR